MIAFGLVFVKPISYHIFSEFTQEKSHLNVNFVAKNILNEVV